MAAHGEISCEFVDLEVAQARCAATAPVRAPYAASIGPRPETSLIPRSAHRGLGYPPPVADDVRIRPMTELDIEGITRIDERITRTYRPEVWERRARQYTPPTSDSSHAAGGGGAGAGVLMREGPARELARARSTPLVA